MITIIQQITIKNQFLLRVTKINIFWHFRLGCTQWIPLSKRNKKRKEMQKKVLSEFSKVEKLFNFTFFICNLCCAWWSEINILFFMSCISSIDLPSVIYYCGSGFQPYICSLINWKTLKVNLFIQWKYFFLGILCARDWVREKRQWSSVVSWKAIIIFIIFLTFSLCLFMFVGWCLQIYELYLRRVNGSFFPYDFNYQ